MASDREIGEEIMAILEQDRAWRRANRRAFLAEIAEDLWRTMPDGEALDDYRLRLQGVPWWASDVVECLEWVLAERPDWAVPTLTEASGRSWWLTDYLPGDEAVYLSWLAEQTAEMRRALDEARGGPRR
jgi:hypothetical protein